MLVSGITQEYYLLNRLWLSSVLRNGRISPKRIAIVVIGLDAECKLLSKKLKQEHPRVHVVSCSLEKEEFGFLNYVDPKLTYSVATDYLKAWCSREFGSCIWMDSDLLVRRDLGPLLAMSQSKWSIMMAEQFKFNKGFSPKPGEYFRIYRRLMGIKGPAIRKNLNAGVVVLNRDFTAEWLSLFHVLRQQRLRAGKAVGVSDLMGMGDLGQLLWNILFWKNSGKKLDQSFNCCYLSKNISEAAAVHYMLDGKARMFADAVNQGISL